MTEDPYQWLSEALSTIHRAGWYRSPRLVQATPGWLNFASNDYLGLAHDPQLQAAAREAIATYGTGSTGSRLVTGHLPVHEALERAIAQLKQTAAALVFSSGYLANLGTIAALVGARDLILADAYNHACLQQGAQLSRATVLTYAHGDLEALETHLRSRRSHHRRCLIVTDSVFSMDGDWAPLREIMSLADAYSAMVLVDEAHGTGVLGHGRGLVAALGITQPLIQVGTLSKAVGSLGGYVAGSKELIEFLRNRASTWIYTTALSPADTAAALRGIELIQREPQRCDRLWQHIEHLRTVLIQPIHTPIIPLHVGDIAQTLAMAQQLQSHGLFIPAIRPPTVPTPRLRLTLSAAHTTAEIAELCACLRHYLPKLCKQV